MAVQNYCLSPGIKIPDHDLRGKAVETKIRLEAIRDTLFILLLPSFTPTANKDPRRLNPTVMATPSSSTSVGA